MAKQEEQPVVVAGRESKDEPLPILNNAGIGMPRPIRTQWDDLGDEISEKSGTLIEGASLTRQEFKDDTDVNKILERLGVDAQLRNDAQYVEVDYTVDLQRAHQLLTEASNTQLNIPDELKDKYPNWYALMQAVESGEYAKDLEELAQTRARTKAEEQRNQRRQDLRDQREAEADLRAEAAAAAARTEQRPTPSN